MSHTSYRRIWYSIIIIAAMLGIPSHVAPVRAQTRALAQQQVRIAAGGTHSLALMTDRTVVGWGDDSVGQTTIPGGLSNVVAIAAGGSHSLALKTDGTVVGWGWNNYGQTTIPGGLSNVVAIAAGDDHSLALKIDGTVVGWGWNPNGPARKRAG